MALDDLESLLLAIGFAVALKLAIKLRSMVGLISLPLSIAALICDVFISSEGWPFAYQAVKALAILLGSGFVAVHLVNRTLV